MRRVYCWLICQFCIMMLGGCGLPRNQIAATHAFGNATAILGALGEEEFVGIRQGIIDMNAGLLALDSAKTTANLTLEGPTSMAATAKRVASAKALKNYGELLLALATAEPQVGLQKAAQAFADSMNSALGDEWAQAQQHAVAEIITGAGSLFLERKKASAVRRIVPAYEKPVDELASLLATDFSLDEEGFLQAYDITARRLKNAAIRVINSGTRYSLAERDSAVRGYRMAETALARAAELQGRFAASIETFRKANRGLAEAIKNREYDLNDIKDYAKQIRALADAYQVLTR
ncbi:MAG TPA: hypothetical protein VFX02_06395 [Gammaproteobacteria bacterium]|nr:hypothetical protein [Gammaproteobacteria bacterium]